LINQGTIANDISDLVLPAMRALANEDLLVAADLPANCRSGRNRGEAGDRRTGSLERRGHQPQDQPALL